MKHLHILLALTLLLPALRAADPKPEPDPLGEWYLLGRVMARQAVPTYREFQYKNSAISRRLSAVLAALGVQTSDIGRDQMQLLQRGWDHGIIDRPIELAPPSSQTQSILPPQLRGYFKFSSKEDE